jgi:bacterioferritin
VLRKELTGINQYFIHSRMCKNWGYDVLAKKHYAESVDEMKHADQIIPAGPLPGGSA